MSPDPQPLLVGDVGGTHARFAVSTCAMGSLEHRVDLTGEFPDFGDVLMRFRELSGLAHLPQRAVIAVAGPVIAGEVRFTNRNWVIRETQLQGYGLAQVRLINDFVALAWAAERLGAGDLRPIGPDVPGLEGGTVSIVGAGTGFGVSCLARSDPRGNTVAMSTEGGHIGFAPSDEREAAVLRELQRRFGHVSVERILSGPGLENLFAALQQVAGRPADRLAAEQIVEGAGRGDSLCRETLQVFCAIYGSVAGDIALVHGALGGVVIAGGIAPKIHGYLAAGGFRTRFEDKGRLTPFVRAIPTRLLCNPDAALLGAACAGAYEARSSLR